ncbi:MAG: rhodanese-like domain-containing protein [Chloroflexi bacterium]|nr:rhodanese-like domain-containing protein [Chloroflexota bacterium]MCH8235920.1 rhodanese-like domain-containing protein [Chloroflexota bacterium]MCH8816256.1 rhodanese-like domain-containing protein [Chloroflexota bacterium]
MPTTVSRDELQRMLDDEDTQLVDVLPAREYAEGRLPGAINLPLKKLNRDTAAVLDRARPVVLY